MYLPIYIFILIELIFVTIGDIKTNKIPNFWSTLNVISFCLLFFVVPDDYAFTVSTILYPIAFLLIGFVLFLLKIMGAGDVKFLSTLFLIVPNERKEEALTLLLISTIIIGGFIFLTNFIKNYEVFKSAIKNNNMQAVKNCFGTKFSYAPVILMAWLWIGWTQKENFIF